VRGAGAAAGPGGQEPGGQPARKVTHVQHLFAPAVRLELLLKTWSAALARRTEEMQGIRVAGLMVLAGSVYTLDVALKPLA
jgi:hypothetical protein